MIFSLWMLIYFTISLYSQSIDISNYQLQWHDEFNSHSLDKTKWDYRYLGKRKLGYNCKQSVFLKNGHLIIRTFFKNDHICTGMISTQKQFKFRYGFIEVRAKVPKIKGIQSAIWLQSDNYGKYINNVSKSGAEIDIMEYIYKKPNMIHFTIHWNGYGKNHKKKHIAISFPKIKDNKWHIFGFLWDRHSYTLFIDGKRVYTTYYPISQTFQYIVLSSEITKWAGPLDISNLPGDFLIDYVRVYQRKDSFQ